MANFVFNIAKGRVAELAERVQNNDPAASVLRVMAMVSTEVDGTLEDLATVAAVTGNANTAEATNTGYTAGGQVITDAAGGLVSDVDNTNNRWNVDLDDITWSSVAAGDNWTDLLIAYDPDGTGTEANMIPLTWHDFLVTPNGGDITAQINDFYRAS